jgi:hypothetical protein
VLDAKTSKVGVHRGYGYGYHGAAVVHPAYGRHCYYRYGRRICT